VTSAVSALTRAALSVKPIYCVLRAREGSRGDQHDVHASNVVIVMLMAMLLLLLVLLLHAP
jgi:hypothetical protein